MEDDKEYVLMDMSSENEVTNQTEFISVNVICRLCANQNDKLIGIYSEDGVNNDLANKMNLYLPVKVYETDDLPLQCCWQCASTVLAWHELVVASIEADRRLRSCHFVTTKELQESINQEVVANLQQQENEGCQDFQDKLSIETQDNTILLPTEPEPLPNKPPSPQADTLSKSCDLCDSHFDSESELQTHLSTCPSQRRPRFRRKKSDIDAPFACPACAKSFTRKFDMHKHVKSKHPAEARSVEPSKRRQNLEAIEKCRIEGAGAYRCDICREEFKDALLLSRHRKTHLERKPHECKLCGRAFKSAAHLKRHVEHLHRGVRNFTCGVCERRFATKFSLEEHLNVHMDYRPFVCEVCGKAFKQKSSLYVHRLYHGDTFPFSCELCQRRFRRRGELVVHQRIHTGARPYGCGVCDKRFRLGHDLKRHVKIHEKNKQVEAGGEMK